MLTNIINEKLNNRIIILNRNKFLENKITKIADKFIKKKAALSPEININASDKTKIITKK